MHYALCTMHYMLLSLREVAGIVDPSPSPTTARVLVNPLVAKMNQMENEIRWAGT
jgi:hypothetical protein